jgi:aspartate racemase
MIKHIGIVACSAEGAALCYKTICIEAQEKMGEYGHPEITMHTPPFSDYMHYIYSGNWDKVSNLMLNSVQILANAGAEFAICPDNTIHQAFDLMIARSPIPWLHIAEVVGDVAKKKGFSNLAILGTKYLMTSPVYPKALKKFGISYKIPEKADREKIDKIIFKELVNGVFLEISRLYFNNIMQKLKDSGCDAAVLGCTEIPLLVDPDNCPLPTLDSTRLLARAAIKKALE